MEIILFFICSLLYGIIVTLFGIIFLLLSGFLMQFSIEKFDDFLIKNQVDDRYLW